MTKNCSASSRSSQSSVLIISFLISVRPIVTRKLQRKFRLHALSKRRRHLDALCLIHIYLVLNSLLRLSKLLVFEFLLGISETFLCSVPAVEFRFVLLDELQLLVLFVGTLTYSEPELFLIYSVTVLPSLLKFKLWWIWICVCAYIFSHRMLDWNAVMLIALIALVMRSWR